MLFRAVNSTENHERLIKYETRHHLHTFWTETGGEGCVVLHEGLLITLVHFLHLDFVFVALD